MHDLLAQAYHRYGVGLRPAL